ncbi:uncharacterized protein PV09_08663 [Verruconis gallopava]|uniref:Aminoglycoside phosphotransferase domain-containing protein n=1 Tax=Verruconis gallopava TaxID=253628 RepID=A0A0D1ZZ74_9PEZI|nr:uncharacterized protein PV09_08663 [Verruconis gallopava]KIV99737.1 hypothetical protein PV09_08663 [Verruconis gallopava]
MDCIALVLSAAVEKILRAIYEDFQLLELDTQGACSYTALLVTTDAGLQTRKIIQARESRFSLNLDITDEATRVYGHLAPATRLLATMPLTTEEGEQTFFFYELDLVPGVPFSDLVPRRKTTDDETMVQQRILVGHLARFFARGWHHKSNRSYCSGRVGSQLQFKLDQLSSQLPSEALRAVARWASDSLPLLETLPVVLTHGDVVPSNIMVHPDTGVLQGMVDWAEAEFLPFGMAFYGLEYLLGFDCKRRDSMTDSVVSFTYYDGAPTLRLHFWSTLLAKIPELQIKPELLKAVHIAKVIGTLLWFGFAWDGGAIDRVVSRDRDADTLAHLEAFLFAEIDAWGQRARHGSSGSPDSSALADSGYQHRTESALDPSR